MEIKDIIGLKIEKIKYSRSKNNGVNFFNSLLKLSNKKIISIPSFPEGSIFEHNRLKFFLSKNLANYEKLIKNQTIKDFHFKYDSEGDFCDWISESAIIELENNCFLIETTCLPNGLSTGLEIISKEDFLKLIKKENSKGITIKSYLTESQK